MALRIPGAALHSTRERGWRERSRPFTRVCSGVSLAGGTLQPPRLPRAAGEKELRD